MNPKAKLKNFSLSEIGNSYRNIIVVFSVLALVLLILILYFAFSKATIVITPKYQGQTVGFLVPIVDQEKATTTSELAEKIPGSFKEVYLEETKEFTSSKISETNGKASGKITIYNKYSAAQPLVATTRFQSPEGLIFRLPEGLIIPANSQVEATVIADEIGTKYEIGPAKFFLPGLSEWRRQYVYAESKEAIKITPQIKYQITQEDLDKALAKFNVELLIKAKEKLTSQIDSKKLVEQFITSETIKKSFSEQVGASKEKFNLALGLKIKALVVSEEQVRKLAIKALPETYRQPGWLTKVDADSFKYEVLTLADNQENLLAQIKGEFEVRTATVEIDKDKLKGMSKNQAEEYLANLSDVESAEIDLPFWTKYLPSLANNITIEVKR